MARGQGTITLSPGAGVKSINIGMQALWYKITVCEKLSGDVVAHLSNGSWVNGNSKCRSIYSDTSGADSFNDNANVINHFERVSGAISAVFVAAHDSTTATLLKINATNATQISDYQLLLEYGDTL